MVKNLLGLGNIQSRLWSSITGLLFIPVVNLLLADHMNYYGQIITTWSKTIWQTCHQQIFWGVLYSNGYHTCKNKNWFWLHKFKLTMNLLNEGQNKIFLLPSLIADDRCSSSSFSFKLLIHYKWNPFFNWEAYNYTLFEQSGIWPPSER